MPGAVVPAGPSGAPPIHRPSRAARPVALAATFLLLASVVAGVALLIAGPPAPRGLPGVPDHPAPPAGIPDPPVDPRRTAPRG
ncbi:hypothetical protein [Streptomyces sp. ST2-7A]|uniref:hypothetical protein n=1 Tax=Streptomyces sp. ST2-7A TaxID=2907214 RepID=UPI001F465972|nr:hypothetical protein [Streptomyces sp. ST2-7A]MCE7082596.1 hypothetical protein [Streptomyces sp. ST2-7A]